jgi:hypothetical protein
MVENSTAMTHEQTELAKQIVTALSHQDGEAFKKLIHPGCPIDEAKIKNVLSTPWTNRYQVRIKSINESFDRTIIKFSVEPESVLEFQVWTKLTNPKVIKMMKGSTEVESVKLFPLARHNKELKILEWPCFK